MPADLDQLFAALGSHADAISVGTAADARRRARRRRHRVVVAAVLATALAGAALAQLRPAPPPDVAPASLVSVASLVLPPVTGTTPPQWSFVRVVDGVAYVARGGDGVGRTVVGALDLATGEAVFAPADLGPWYRVDGLYATAAGLLLIGRPGPDGVVSLVGLDPGTGAQRWRHDADPGRGLVLDTTVVMPQAGAVVAWDLATGVELWRVAGVSLVPVLPPVPTFPAVSLIWDQDPADHRVLLADPENVTVRDARSGGVTAALPVAAPADLWAVGDTLYLAIGDTLHAYPMAGGPLRTVYVAAEDETVSHVVGCGEQLVCAEVRTDSGGLRTVGIDVRNDSLRWSRDGLGSVVGDRYLDVLTGRLFDLDGGLVSLQRTDRAFWLAADRVLTLTVSVDTLDGTTESTAAAVDMVSAVDGAVTELGRAEIAWPNGACGVDTRHLVCAVLDGFRAWRFDGGPSSPR